MNEDRIGNWMQTYTGKAFWPLDPRVEEIDIEDIAHSLAYQCRYAGHCLRFYSVAEHSVYVSHLCSEENAFWGLMHDAAEAYVSDVPRPLKRSLPQFADIETKVMRAISEKFNMYPWEPLEVKHFDNVMLGFERDQIMSKPPMPWSTYDIPESNVKMHLNCWDPARAETEFLERFRELTGGGGGHTHPHPSRPNPQGAAPPWL